MREKDQSSASEIRLDYAQTMRLMALFGGQPGEISLMQGEGHSGAGIYAYFSEYPEEGAFYLGQTNPDALPTQEAASVSAMTAQQLASIEQAAQALAKWRDSSALERLQAQFPWVDPQASQPLQLH